MLVRNLLLINNFIKHYQTLDFINKLMAARRLCKKCAFICTDTCTLRTCFFYKHDVYKHIQVQVW